MILWHEFSIEIFMKCDFLRICSSIILFWKILKYVSFSNWIFGYLNIQRLEYELKLALAWIFTDSFEPYFGSQKAFAWSFILKNEPAILQRITQNTKNSIIVIYVSFLYMYTIQSKARYKLIYLNKIKENMGFEDMQWRLNIFCEF